ncbi:hypothetical protein [Noviherbaspirillum sp.]|uniref:hypothetical protein n=1 Tax=Noviherbaspirillum sp. TaxID=1926288 RepID=UPI002D2AC2E7|nr:hypothetical protein [Noviherbaspirillum sp.]HZW23092.1 hypothetical protein [Noviherbaspirillum sp.]
MIDERIDEEEGMDPVAMQALYARTLYRLRESRKALLKQYGVDEEAQLLERIRDGEVGEHPAYEHWLGAQIIEQGRQQLREEMMVRYGGKAPETEDAVSLHLMFQERIEDAFAARLAEPVRMAQDALLLSFDTGLMMEVRYLSVDAFSVHWTWGEAELRLDTAPVHAGTDRHLHRDDGSVTEDPVGVCNADPWTGFARLIDALLVDPLLGGD